MKKYFVLCLLVTLTLTGCKKQEAPVMVENENVPMELPAEAFEPQFESEAYGFRVMGPQGWVKEADSLGMLVTYLNPGDPETFQENITIAREIKTDGMDLETYASATRDQVLAFFETAELNLEQDKTVGGLAGKQFRFVLNVEGLMLETEQVVVERETEFMVFTFMSTPEQFSAAYPEFVKLLNTVQFVGSEGTS